MGHLKRATTTSSRPHYHKVIMPLSRVSSALAPVQGSGRDISDLIIPLTTSISDKSLLLCTSLPKERPVTPFPPLGSKALQECPLCDCTLRPTCREAGAPSRPPPKLSKYAFPTGNPAVAKCPASSPYRSSIIRIEITLSFVGTGGGKARGVVQLHGAAGTKTNNGSNNILISKIKMISDNLPVIISKMNAFCISDYEI